MLCTSIECAQTSATPQITPYLDLIVVYSYLHYYDNVFLLGTKEILQQQTGRYLVKTFHRLMKTTSTTGKDTNGKSESVSSPRTMYLFDCLPFLQQAFVKSRAGVPSAQDSAIDLNALVKYVTKMQQQQQQQHMVENNKNMIELSKEFNQNIARKLVVDYDVITHLIVTPALYLISLLVCLLQISFLMHIANALHGALLWLPRL